MKNFTLTEKKSRLIDVILIISFTIIPSTLNAFLGYYLSNNSTNISTSIDFLSTILDDIPKIFLILYVIYKGHRNIKDYGFSFEWDDLFKGLVLLLVASLFSNSVTFIFEKLGITYFNPQNIDAFSNRISFTYILVILINPWFEELLRAYLITEIKFITDSRILSVIITVILQGSYHIYQGWFAMFVIMIDFLFYSIYFSKTNKIMPVVVAHSVSNLMIIFKLAQF
jgi:membrane protease YdiL (CAAX protease family)